MMSERTEKIRDAVEVIHRVKATHIESQPVREMFGEKVAWEGVVEVFEVSGHPRAKRCYGWSYSEGGQTQFVTVLEIPPVTSAQTAVRASIAAQARSNAAR